MLSQMRICPRPRVDGFCIDQDSFAAIAKFLLVIGLSGYQGWLGSYANKLANGQRPLSGKAVRILNEIPGIAAAIIVVLVIVRPF